MPYQWTPPDAPHAVLRLWPHRSLPERGFAAMILMAFVLGTVPLYGLLGTVFFWALLPFILLMVIGLWWAIRRSYRDGEIIEELALDGDDLVLRHKPVSGAVKEWRCNAFWVRADLHVTGGRLPYYITMTGNGRLVELGAFLSETERKALYGELQGYLQRLKAGGG